MSPLVYPHVLDHNLDRRKLIAAMGSLAGTAALAPFSQALAQGAAGTVKLRLLETTDIHVNLLPYDYYRDAKDDTVGLAKLATLIGKARALRQWRFPAREPDGRVDRGRARAQC